MYSHTTPNLSLYKGLNILLQVWERGKSTFYTKLKSCMTAPQLQAVTLLCCRCVLPWLGTGAALAPLKVPEEIVLSLTVRFIHLCKYPATIKSHGDLEAKHERCSRCGYLGKNSAKGPSSQTLLVNATSIHEKSSGKILLLQACTTGLRAARGRSRGNWQQGDTGERQDCPAIQLQSRN